MSDNVNVHVIYKVHGGTVRCEALTTLLRDKLGHGAVTAGSADRAVAYVRDVIAIAQSTLQPEACRPGTDWRGNNFDHLGKATVVVVVDDLPYVTITLTRDNKVIASGIEWEGPKAEWERHRGGSCGPISSRVD